MNVGELKKWIKDNGVPDDTPVVLHTEADEYHMVGKRLRYQDLIADPEAA